MPTAWGWSAIQTPSSIHDERAVNADASPTNERQRGGDGDRDGEPEGVALNLLAIHRQPPRRRQRGQGQPRMAQRVGDNDQCQRQDSPAQQQHDRVGPARQARHHDERQAERAGHGTHARPPHGDEPGAQAAEHYHRHPKCAIRRDGEREQRGEGQHCRDGRALEAPSAAGREPTRDERDEQPGERDDRRVLHPPPQNMGDSDWSDEGEGDSSTEQPVEAIERPCERMPRGGGGASVRTHMYVSYIVREPCLDSIE